MLEFIDTHAHLYDVQFDKDRKTIVQNAINEGVNKFFLPNINSETIAGMFELEKQYPQNCFALMGLHPCAVKDDFEKELAIIEKNLAQRKFVAIGEIGTDLHWDKTFWEQQKEAFSIQIQWAKKYKIPIVIHCRASFQETIELLAPHAGEDLRGVFHCFGGSENSAKTIIDLGFYMGIGGVVTYKKSGLDSVLIDVPLEYLVLETDSPYLAPVPHRGKRNESSYIPIVAQKLAEIKGVSLEEISKKTTQNALNLFQMA
ncbi:MAG: TatD family deoxyribonuclease [Bacteroidetes bacterium]|nr:MAG: TatD family deoxyribonuclease [Bacteroidota bacterium]TAG86995.1 MAG: TatD family deoxyribonuclease [Bacteroidota bacterium]